MKVSEAYITRHYDNDSAEHEATAPAGDLTIEELTAIARDYAKMTARDDSYFRTMTMDELADVQISENLIDISFTFTEGDFSTDITVTFVAR